MRQRLDLIFILLIAVLMSVCGMGYELLIVRLLSTISANAVLSQSLTVGAFLISLGFGAYLSSHMKPRSPWTRLVQIEILISLLAVVCLPAVAMMAIYILQPVRLIFTAQIFTILIGTLAGLELPMLIALARPHSPRAFGLVLTANYVGSLLASIFLPTRLIPAAGVYLSGWFFAAITAAVAALLYARAMDFRPRVRIVGLLIAFALPPFFAKHADQLEQFYLKSFYFVAPVGIFPSDIRSTLEAQAMAPRVLRFATPYQDIDLVKDDLQLFGSQKSTGFNLFIDERNQFGSDTEQIYHDTIVHGSFNMIGKVPKKVLVIGGGDGLLARELLKYPEIESIRQIELDPQMVRIANHYKPLLSMNGGSFMNKRVHVENADGFSWLRQSSESFDAIFVDLPHPISVDLSRLYSIEFYRFVHARLNPHGFLVFDFPFDGLIKMSSRNPGNPATIKSVLAAISGAGFKSYQAIGSWESFLVASTDDQPLEFDYNKLSDLIAPMSAFNMTTTKLPHPDATTRPNSIFRPITLKIRVDGAG